MITYHVEEYSDVIDELRPLLVRHYEELSEHREHGIALEPQDLAYRQREADGSLTMFIAREQGEIVAYMVTFVCPALHYQSCLSALPDIFYVLPERRRSAIGSELFDFAEKALRRRGVRAWIVGGKVKHPVEALFAHQQFSPFESLWIKWLEPNKE
jgi:GNAT superfamily N-acetyltransferase